MHVSVVYILVFLSSYLIGSIPFSWIVTKLKTGEDIRKIGSGNVGGRNVYRATKSSRWAYFAGFLDVSRSVTAVIVPYFLANILYFSKTGGNILLHPFIDIRWCLCLTVAGMGAILGHNWPLYLLSAGGKGITVVLASLIFANPILLGFWIAFWPVIITIIGYSSITYIVVTVLVGVIGFFLPTYLLMPWAPCPLSLGLLLIGISLIMLSRQKENFQKIRSGEAKKMKIWKGIFGKKKLSDEMLK
ncbi:MAG: glycerol-3-phosphate acyltransferase [Candidatus Heimdallarchaeota archaeon]|nr:glycerol-3-phosphate acyltransferase [Candidatus Heimdallarchaeota archaeon]MCG3255554.1 glycerol-3-phosphate acyltransferase [Candidatus Heimdallarchaeota archaeon]MCK4610629.1 glycerol-3-phosphate acyltransferase [Candidatus Heimdallarchaeota archaeon]